MPFTIEVTAATGGTRSIPLPPEGLTIGRQQDNALILDDRQVSRHHARIEQRGADIVVSDLGTANGSYLNGQRIAGSSPFRPGDTLHLGETTLRLKSAEAATIVGTSPPQWSTPAPPGPPPAPFANAPTPGVAPAPYPGAFPPPGAVPAPGGFPPPGTVAPPPARGKSRLPLILGIIAGVALLLCVCIFVAPLILGAIGLGLGSTGAGSSNPVATTTLPVSSTAPLPGGSIPGSGRNTAGVTLGDYACTLPNGQFANRIIILDGVNYTDASGTLGRYSYDAASRTITWESGTYQQLVGFFVPAGEAAFGSPAATARIYNRDSAGSGTPFDGTTRDNAFSRCAP